MVLLNMTTFHKIASKEVPAYIVMEDEDCIAFLDIYPTHQGQCVVIPKEYTTSKFSQADSDLLVKTINFAQKLAVLIEEKMPNILRCEIIIEGFEIDYLHIKVMPIGDLSEVVHKGGLKADEEDLLKIHSVLTN